MREILFRGKTTLDNEWVIGAGVYKSEGHTWIITDDITKTENRGTGSDAINPETVGQYTGLTDKNGTKIFEGDIVKHYNNSDDGFDIGALYWDETFSQWRRTSIGNFHHSSFTYMMSHSCDYEVIGNIHDNPELLKGGVQE